MKLYCEIVEGKGAIALLALRLVAGPAFILHGWGKIQHATSWMGDALPGWLQALGAIAEFGGGIGLLLGLLTHLSALGIAIVMLVAIFHVHVPQGHPFVGHGEGGSWELAAAYLAMSVALVLRGPGAYSVDALIHRKKT